MQISPQFIKKIIDTKKRITDLLVLYPLCPKYSNVFFMIKSLFFMIKNTGNTLSRYQMGYRKVYSSKHSLIAVFEKWKGSLDKGVFYL